MPPVGASWPSRGSQGGSRPSPGDDRSGRRPGHGELDLEWPVTATPATGGFFQRPEPFFGVTQHLATESGTLCAFVLTASPGGRILRHAADPTAPQEIGYAPDPRPRVARPDAWRCRSRPWPSPPPRQRLTLRGQRRLRRPGRHRWWPPALAGVPRPRAARRSSSSRATATPPTCGTRSPSHPPGSDQTAVLPGVADVHPRLRLRPARDAARSPTTSAAATPSPMPRTAADAVDDLHALLTRRRSRSLRPGRPFPRRHHRPPLRRHLPGRGRRVGPRRRQP